MTIDKMIFGFRFATNDELFPNQDDLRIFFESPKDENGMALLGEDLTVNGGMLDIPQ